MLFVVSEQDPGALICLSQYAFIELQQLPLLQDLELTILSKMSHWSLISL
jgi:hypothetical protein